MKLWSTTTENKCFVKMLWHLLGECVKTTVLLVYSSGSVAIVAIAFFFFFSLPFVLFFLLYILFDWRNKFHNIFTIIEVSISYKLK